MIEPLGFTVKNEYDDRLIAYIDILGFKSLVYKIESEDDFHKVRDLLLALKSVENNESTDVDILPFYKNLTITAVSDSVIFTTPYHNPDDVVALFFKLHRLQYELLAGPEILIRGYLTKGPVYHKQNVIFGKGYIEAYKKEQEIRHAPRIVIDPVLVGDFDEKVKTLSDEMDHCIYKDTCDKAYFIDYLKPLGIKRGIPKEQYIKERCKIKKFIERNLSYYKNNDKIIQKYNWLNDYVLLTDHYLA